MFGQLIAELDNPSVASGLAAALDQPSLMKRLASAAAAEARPAADVMASTVRGFLEVASDDDWLQLIGIMNRAEDPSLAALRAILDKALPAGGER
ncbi:MAG: hypothetical protein AB1586_30720 [Pseudomonadota bacterium]|jgi:hypothetical protein